MWVLITHQVLNTSTNTNINTDTDTNITDTNTTLIVTPKHTSAKTRQKKIATPIRALPSTPESTAKCIPKNNPALFSPNMSPK